MTARPAAGGGRRISVDPERLSGWLDRFSHTHGPTSWDPPVWTAADGTEVEMEVPFPPLDGPVLEHITASRRVGVLLVRLHGFAVGIFDGDQLIVSKVGSRPVHGRSAAGGQSQQRFARRREGQAAVALAAAADVAARLLVPAAAELDAVVTGGDRGAVARVLLDRRLAALRPLVTPRLLDVSDPRLTVLQQSPQLFRAVHLVIRDPAGVSEPQH